MKSFFYKTFALKSCSFLVSWNENCANILRMLLNAVMLFSICKMCCLHCSYQRMNKTRQRFFISLPNNLYDFRCNCNHNSNIKAHIVRVFEWQKANFMSLSYAHTIVMRHLSWLHWNIVNFHWSFLFFIVNAIVNELKKSSHQKRYVSSTSQF